MCDTSENKEYRYIVCRARKLEQAERRCEGLSAESFETQIESDKMAR
jgi:hypothetical protein